MTTNSNINSNEILGISLQSLERKNRTKKIVVTGAHPGDPEAGCGGLVALLTAAGHEVTLCYLTTGEAGIEGKSYQEAAAIRKEESKKSSRMLNATPYYFGQIDGATKIDDTQYDQMHTFLVDQNPDLILTHWIMDTHIDHRACGILTYGAWLNLNRRPNLYFYEVMPGGQTQNFIPTDYANISEVVELKRQACYLHESQKMKELYSNDHERMEEFRGMESGYRFAEAFIGHARNKNGFI